jgi:hypothetical protein
LKEWVQAPRGACGNEAEEKVPASNRHAGIENISED